MCVTSLSALLALCEHHSKTGRLRVQDNEASLSAGKESDQWHETLAPRRIPEAVRTLPANYRTDPSKALWSCSVFLSLVIVVMLCLPFSGKCDHALSSFLW